MPDYPLGVLIKHIQIQISKSLNHRLEQMNLTGSQAHVLVFLMHRTGQRTTLRDLEEYLHQSHVTVTGLVQRLVQKGFVTAQVDETDRRCRLLTLTPKATGTLEAIHSHLKRTEEQLLQDFTPEEQELLQKLLVKAAKNIEATLPPTRNGHPVEPPPIGRC